MIAPRFVSMATRGRSWWRLAQPRNRLAPLEWALVVGRVVLFVLVCALVAYVVASVQR